MKYTHNKEIILVVDIKYKDEEYKAGSVFMSDCIDEFGFAHVYKIDTGFFSNEYELYVPSLENK